VHTGWAENLRKLQVGCKIDAKRKLGAKLARTLLATRIDAKLSKPVFVHTGWAENWHETQVGREVDVKPSCNTQVGREINAK
jgi:hypothetical protein